MSTTKGTYYRKRTKEWFDKRGYRTEYLEKYSRGFLKGRVFIMKKDLFASDGLSIGNGEIIFWNSKLGRDHISHGIKDFKKIGFPKCPQIKVWLVIWEPNARDPDIVDVNEVEDVK